MILLALLPVLFGLALAYSQTGTPAGLETPQQTSSPRVGSAGAEAGVDQNSTSRIIVKGLGISEALAQANEDDPDFYLSHTVAGEPSPIGSAFMDYRCSQASKNIVIYGHNFTGSNRMFSPLRLAWEQSTFDVIDYAELSCLEAKTRRYIPLCAFKVDASDQEVQQFDFDSTREYRAWLKRLIKRSSSKADHPVRLVNRSRSSLCLITCASARPHQEERTLVIFILL